MLRSTAAGGIAYENISATGSAARNEVRSRIDAHKDAVLKDVQSLRLDVVRRRSELRHVLWHILRLVDWESHALLLLRNRRIKSVEGQLAESFIDPNVQPEARDRVIRALMSWYVDKGRTEKVDHWRKYLSEMEDP